MLNNHLRNDEEILSDRDMNLRMARILKTEHVGNVEVVRKIRKYKGNQKENEENTPSESNTHRSGRNCK